MVYYNEHDPFAAEWLRELSKAGLIAAGEVDERDIREVRSQDLKGFTQHHFFAGIGGWSYALRLAGWEDDREVWTGSCPCQPFSAAGKGVGFADPRDLWPIWFSLIRECGPPVLFGEQVEAAIAHGWLDRLCNDLEGEGYAVGAVGLPAASVGAFHIRQRLWFVADRDGSRCGEGRTGETGDGRDATRVEPAGLCTVSKLGHPSSTRLPEQRSERGASRGAVATDTREAAVEADTSIGRLADTMRERGQQIPRGPSGNEATDGRAGRDAREPDGDYVVAGDGEGKLSDTNQPVSSDGELQRSGRLGQPAEDTAIGFWSPCDWLPCADGKARPVEPGTFPLAYGVPNRVGRLRGYGNAIVPQVAAEFINAYMEDTSCAEEEN